MLTAKMRRGSCLSILLIATICFFSLTSMWQNSDVSQIEEEPANILKKDNEYNVNFPQPQETFKENLPFRYFDAKSLYQTEGIVTRSLNQYEMAMVTKAKEVVQEKLENLKPDSSFVNGRYRWLPDGVEYDLLYRESTTLDTTRVSLFQKLEVPKVIMSREINKNTMVNIVVTLRGRLDKYALFLDHLVQRVLPTDQNLSLTIIYFADAHTLEAKEMTRSKLGTIPKFHWSFVPLEDENFSRGKGLHVGAQTINHKSAEESKQGSRQSGNEILFFCDVDVLMHPNFFDHCRSNTLQGHQVYYPVVFSLYNPKLVYPLFDKGVPGVDGQLTISDESGFWRVFGFGMTCMYSSDYEASGGFPDIKTWGGEDEALYEKFLQMKNIKVLRSPDPSLFHLYHQKECLDITSTSYPACLKSKALTEGSQLQLGLALLKLHEGIDMEGILSKRFYYFWLVPYLGILLVFSLLTNVLQASSIFFRSRGRLFRAN